MKGLFCVVMLSAAAFAQSAPSVPPQAVTPKVSPQSVADAQRIQEERLHNDWAYLEKYRAADAQLAAAGLKTEAGEMRVVFMGDSITENWGRSPEFGEFFPGRPYVNRGISGQTSPQMLVRFRQDVIALRPAVVVILAGTNDIAENTGKMLPEDTENNLRSMVDLARANGIRVVLCSVLPAKSFGWRPELTPAGKIVALNAWIKGFAAERRLAYVDYYSAMVDGDGGLKAELSGDGVHPNGRGYAVMGPLVERGIAESLKK